MLGQIIGVNWLSGRGSENQINGFRAEPSEVVSVRSSRRRATIQLCNLMGRRPLGETTAFRRGLFHGYQTCASNLARSTKERMRRESKEQWMQLCAQAAVEQDPEILMELVKEIDRFAVFGTFGTTPICSTLSR